MLIGCIDVELWDKQSQQTKGSRAKQWVFNPAAENSLDLVYLFKESHRRYPWEFWAEIIASEVGNIFGIWTPEVRCARLNNKYAALVKYFLKIDRKELSQSCIPVETLVEGGDLIVSIDSQFDRKAGERHNIFDVEKVFNDFGTAHFFSQFLEILVFDSIIGNTDRHQDNWGFIVDLGIEGNKKLAPAYDNSTSLGSELLEEKLDNYLEDETKLKNYLMKGKPHLRWSVDGKDLKRINHFEFLDNISKQHPEIIGIIEKMTQFSDEVIESILFNFGKIDIQVQKYMLSSKRKQLIQKIICVRRDLLKERFQLK